ncbi:hypothetical protein [Rhodococcus qingshengii]|nr:hypothetical protein [Rhodococcus qingshengii]
MAQELGPLTESTTAHSVREAAIDIVSLTELEILFAPTPGIDLSL